MTTGKHTGRFGADQSEEDHVLSKIDAIMFRAERALFTELSLVYDEAALCETREERVQHLTRAQEATATWKALVGTANNVGMKILKKEIPPVLPQFFKDIMEVETCDDDEKIAEFLLKLEDHAKAHLNKVLREYVESEFVGGSDEHS